MLVCISFVFFIVLADYKKHRDRVCRNQYGLSDSLGTFETPRLPDCLRMCNEMEGCGAASYVLDYSGPRRRPLCLLLTEMSQVYYGRSFIVQNCYTKIG